MAGRSVPPYDKMPVDLAFDGAWRISAFRARFQVSTDLAKGLDGVHAMTRADEQKHVSHLCWEREGKELRVMTRSQWDDEYIDPDVVADGLDGDVPATGWLGLAQSFLERFDR